jgi:galactokinase
MQCLAFKQAGAEVVLLCVCRCERFVGTQGGGMDQAISVLAQEGCAMHVKFNPVGITTDALALVLGVQFVTQ